MTKDAIITIPNPLLRQKSKRVGYIDESITKLADDMIHATLDWENSRDHEFGAALAAVQVGQLYRIVIIRNDFDNKSDTSFNTLINPEIVKSEGELLEDMEGCLSVTDIYGSVPRYPKVKIKALNLDGSDIRLTATGFLARVLQHEIDHTNGKVFLDRVSDPHKLFRLEQNGQFSPLTSS